MSLQNRQFRDNIQGIGYNVPKEESQQLDESKLTLQEQKNPEMLMKMMSKMGGAPEGGMPKTPPMPKMGGGEGGTPKLDPEMIKKLMKMMQGGMVNAGTELPTDNQLTEGIWDDILRFFFPDSPETAIHRLEQERKRKEKERLQHHYDSQPTQGPSAIPSKHI